MMIDKIYTVDEIVFNMFVTLCLLFSELPDSPFVECVGKSITIN